MLIQVAPQCQPVSSLETWRCSWYRYTPVYMCPLLLCRGSWENGFGGVTGSGKQQGTWDLRSMAHRCLSLLHILFQPGYQASIQLWGHIQREAHNVICVLCLSCAKSTIIYLFIPTMKIKREMKTHLFHYFFLHSSAFQLTKIHIYANMRHLFPPLPHMGDGSQARINDIASAVMFAAFH